MLEISVFQELTVQHEKPISMKMIAKKKRKNHEMDTVHREREREDFMKRKTVKM